MTLCNSRVNTTGNANDIYIYIFRRIIMHYPSINYLYLTILLANISIKDFTNFQKLIAAIFGTKFTVNSINILRGEIQMTIFAFIGLLLSILGLHRGIDLPMIICFLSLTLVLLGFISPFLNLTHSY